MFIIPFKDITLADLPRVGGKNASIGQMIKDLSSEGIRIPNGFAITAEAYWHYLNANNLLEPLKKIMAELDDPENIPLLQKIGKQIRQRIADAAMPSDLQEAIIGAYTSLSKEYKTHVVDVAVRSSATAEDLPTASFAGQQETFLNVMGNDALIGACKNCFASLFTDRAIIYRINQGFDHFEVALSIGVQKMIRSDLASAGVAFSLDTQTGFRDLIMIEAAYGLGEVLVKGAIMPDEYKVFKPTLKQGFASIIEKRVGNKEFKLVYASDKQGIKKESVASSLQKTFCLNDDEILKLAKDVQIIETLYSSLNNKWTPMDVEWAKDGNDGKLYILQARPETVHAVQKAASFFKQYALVNGQKHTLLITGQSIGQKIVCGPVRIVSSIEQVQMFSEGDILVTSMTDPDWVPLMKKAGGIITDQGGRTCHAAIVSRELGISAIVGTHNATAVLKDSQNVTLDCTQGQTGFVYEGEVEYIVKEIDLEHLKKPQVELLVNIADPARSFVVSRLPFVQGVGLARLEFIIANQIKAHPMAFVAPEKITQQAVLDKVDDLAGAYKNYEDFFVESLAQGIATIAAAFYPRPVLVRFSDFKSSEYRNLIAGQFYEPAEHNPMLGLRGASRYYSPLYKKAFQLEVKAVKRVREVIGLTNVNVMVPFVRTVAEAQTVLEIIKDAGLDRKDLKIFMMVEIPSNVILLDQFAQLFDGFSIGSNDLAQFTLAVDRDSALLSQEFNETDEAVLMLMKDAIEKALKNKKYIGICGQAPSDYPHIAQQLIEWGINSLSLNPDAVISFLLEE